ncbi:MAG: non-ribosomal peptide synthetase, partial [Gemmatimonadaceae bacterium]
MMTIHALLARLAEGHVRLRRRGDELLVSGKQSRLDPDLIAEVNAWKAELLSRIGATEGWWSPPHVVTPDSLSLVQLTQRDVDRIAAVVSGGLDNIQDIYPLAPLQEGILFHHLMVSDGDPYLMPSLMSFESKARLSAYLSAFQALIDRHDILRTAVVWDGLPEPVQVVLRRAMLHVEEVELDSREGSVADQLRARFDPRRMRLDVRQAPMLRAYIAKDERPDGTDGWLLLMLRHHLVSDHRTREILQEEIAAHLMGEADRLPAPVPFRNFITRTLQGAGREQHETFFREMLGDVSEMTAPYGLVDVHRDGTEIRQARRRVDDRIAKRLRARARALEVSVGALCHVAWAQVLARVSGRTDVVFGTVLFGRMQAGARAERILGMLINTLPVRVRLDDESAATTVRRTHRMLAELLEHEHASLALAQRCSGVLAPAPLFSAILNYRHGRGKRRALAEVHEVWKGISTVMAEAQTNYPLMLAVDDYGDGLALTAQTVAPVDEDQVCRLMEATLDRLATALESDPTARVRRLDVLPAEDRRRLVDGWNATEREFPETPLIHEQFEAQVGRTPNALAAIAERHDGAVEQLTYAELDRRANALARALRALGVGPEARVAVCLDRSLGLITAMMGVLKAGGAYVPLDPTYPVDRLRYMLADAEPRVVLTQSLFGAEQTASAMSQLFANTTLPLLDVDAAWPSGDAGAAPRWMPPGWAGSSPIVASLTSPASLSSPHDGRGTRVGMSADQMAYVIYTSGSTGTPKGATNTHRGVVNHLRSIAAVFPIEQGSACPIHASPSFDGTVTTFFAPLLVGQAIRLLPSSAENDGLLRAAASGSDFGFLKVTPSHLDMLAAALSPADVAACARSMSVGGEVLRPDQVAFWRQHAPATSLVNHYGATEAAVGCCVHVVTDADAQAPLVPIGRPMANSRIYVLDDEQELLPEGVPGELCIGGVQVGRGYWKRAALTAQKFVPDPFGQPGGRLYRTGDVGRRRTDGELEFLGRNDDQVKIRGYRIERGEIEAVLGLHPAIQQAVVLAREDVPGERQLVAYYVAPGVDADVLRTYLAERLPAYMVPAAYVPLASLPLTPNGKIDRRNLPAPGDDAFARRGYEAPADEMEQALAELWSQTLRVDRVGRWDDFFALGGHSLVAVRFIARARQALNLELAVADLFRAPVLADFARIVRVANRATFPPIAIVARDSDSGAPVDAPPLSYAQQRLWFLEQLGGLGPTYHIAWRLRLRGPLEAGVLR